jgi:hypothetical protein
MDLDSLGSSLVDTIPERSVITSDERADSDSWTEPDQQSGDSPKLHVRSPGACSSINSPPPMMAASTSSPFSSLITTNTTTSTNGHTAAAATTAITNTVNSANHNSALASNIAQSVGTINDQLTKMLPPDDGFPDLIVFVLMEHTGPGIYYAMLKIGVKVLGMEGEADLKVALPHLVGKLQKFCNNNAKTPPPLDIVVVGPDYFLNSVTKNYVTQLSTRPNDWQNYFSFLYAPFSSKSL